MKLSRADANEDGAVTLEELRAARDAAGISVTHTNGGTSVTETGSTDTFHVALTGRPLSDVVLMIRSNDETEATINKSSLTFTPDNWDITQELTVTGIDDSVADGAQLSTVTLSVDPAQAAVEFESVPDQNIDVVTINDETSAGNIDGDVDFDANDSFIIQLLLLGGSDTQIEQSKGGSLLATGQIRSLMDHLRSTGDVDGDQDFDANDSFLIHLVMLSGTNAQIDLSKGPSPLSASQIRANINGLGTRKSGTVVAQDSEVVRAVNAVPRQETTDEELFPEVQSESVALTIAPSDEIPVAASETVWDDMRHWIDLI